MDDLIQEMQLTAAHTDSRAEAARIMRWVARLKEIKEYADEQDMCDQLGDDR